MTKKSKRRKLILLVVLLIAVSAVYFIVEKINKEKQESELLASSSEETDSIVIKSVDTEKVASFSYTYDGVEYQFYKENDSWYCENDTTKELNQDKVSQLAENFKNVTASRLVEETARDLSQYGLDQPSNMITVTDLDQNTISFEIGNQNEIAGGYYIKMETDDTVYLVNSFPAAFSYSLEDLLKTEDESTDTTEAEETTESTETTTQN